MKLDLTPLLPARGGAAWLAAQLHHPDAGVKVRREDARLVTLRLTTPDLYGIILGESRGDRVVFEAFRQFPNLSHEAGALMKQFAAEVVQAANDALRASVAPLELPALDVTGMTAPVPAAPAPAAAPANGTWAVMLMPSHALPYALLAPSKRAAQLLGCETLLDGGHLNARLPEVQEFARELDGVREAGNGPTQALYDAAAALQPLLSGSGMMRVGPVHEVTPHLQP
jgi:hypothetical protein